MWSTFNQISILFAFNVMSRCSKIGLSGPVISNELCYEIPTFEHFFYFYLIFRIC